MTSGVRTVRHESDLGRWEMTLGIPAAPLRPYVRRYLAYDVEMPEDGERRRELPSGDVPMIVNLGPPLTVIDRYSHAERHVAESFVAGLHDTYAITKNPKRSLGIEIRFTPLGATTLLGTPMGEVTHRLVTLDELLGPEGGRLVARLSDATPTRAFDTLDETLLGRLHPAHDVDRVVAWTWHRLVASGGRARIGELADAAGWSHKRLIARFTEQAGLPPKTIARMIRFDAIVRALDGRRTIRWAELATAFGYHDQPHLIRDFHRFAGSTPSEFVARRLPDAGGVVD